MTHLCFFKSINMALQLSNAELDDYFQHLERLPWLFEIGKILTFWRFFGTVVYEPPRPPENTILGRFWARFYETWQLGTKSFSFTSLTTILLATHLVSRRPHDASVETFLTLRSATDSKVRTSLHSNTIFLPSRTSHYSNLYFQIYPCISRMVDPLKRKTINVYLQGRDLNQNALKINLILGWRKELR